MQHVTKGVTYIYTTDVRRDFSMNNTENGSQSCLAARGIQLTDGRQTHHCNGAPSICTTSPSECRQPQWSHVRASFIAVYILLTSTRFNGHCFTNSLVIRTQKWEGIAIDYSKQVVTGSYRQLQLQLQPVSSAAPGVLSAAVASGSASWHCH